MSKRPFVVYWNNIPTPYMIDRFNALADRDNLEFEAWFNDRTHVDRSWLFDETKWRFRYRYTPTIHLLGRSLHWPVAVLGRRPDVLVSLYASPSFIAGSLIARLRGVKTGFRVLKTFDTWIQRNSIKDRVRHFLFRTADLIETPGDDARDYAVRNGANPERVFRATHTVDLDHFRSHSLQTDVEVEAFRSRLGLIGVVFCYAGRLWSGKGLDTLLHAFLHVQNSISGPCSLIVLGDGPEDRQIRHFVNCHGVRNVHLLGFRQRDELPQFLSAADVFVFPTLGDPYGIIVDEAMACGLPIISTNAAGEIHDRVKDGTNGFVVPAGDSAAMAEKMTILAGNRQLRERMGLASRRIVDRSTPWQWACDFEQMIRHITSTKS